MRGGSNYYDHSSGPQSQSGGVDKGGWTGTPATPFGVEEPAPPAAWQAPARPGGKRRRRGVLWAALAAGLLLVLAGSFFAVNGLPRVSVQVSTWSGAPDGGEDTAAPTETPRLPQAPLGTGVTLELFPPEEEALAPREIYERISPAVVSVRAESEWGARLGTGLIVTGNGYIVTNAHVIDGAQAVTVVRPGGDQMEPLLVGFDTDTDLAVLKVGAEGLTPVRFGDSDALRVGDSAYAIGNPLGEALWGTMTDGIISAIDRVMETEGGDVPLLQTTAALNSGNSGGALVNACGQVVGITHMKMMSPRETVEGLGFAIPSATVKAVVDEIIEQGYYSGQPMLGITIQAVPAHDGAPAGLYVVEVAEGSDAWKKGVAAGDIILTANGEPTLRTDDLFAVKDKLKTGESITLELWNDGLIRRLSVQLVSQRDLK